MGRSPCGHEFVVGEGGDGSVKEVVDAPGTQTVVDGNGEGSYRQQDEKRADDEDGEGFAG